MKKIILITCLVISIVSCKDNTKKQEDSISPVPENIEKKIKADIDFSSNPVAERYRSAISEQYDELDVNFASFYIVTTWGCGSGCVTGAMVDTRDGSVYSMPQDKEWGGNGTYIESNKESAILLTSAVAQSPTGETEETRKYWEWNEELKEFRFVRVESVRSNGNE